LRRKFSGMGALLEGPSTSKVVQSNLIDQIFQAGEALGPARGLEGFSFLPGGRRVVKRFARRADSEILGPVGPPARSKFASQAPTVVVLDGRVLQGSGQDDQPSPAKTRQLVKERGPRPLLSPVGIGLPPPAGHAKQ